MEPTAVRDLTKFIVQFAGDVAQRRFLSRDEFLCEFTAALGNFRQTSEKAAVPANQRKAVEQDRKQGSGEEEVHLTLDAIVDLDNALSGLFFVFAVLYKKAGNGRTERGLAFLEREFDLAASFFFLSRTGEGEDAIDRVPELSDGTGQKCALFGSTADSGEPGFKSHGVVEIGTDALELGRPRCEGVGLIAADHIAHGYGEKVEVILNAKELERIFAIAVDEVGLQFA